MKIGKGKIAEILLNGSLWVECSPDLIPSPGQYLHAYKPASDAPLPVSLFSIESTPSGFRSAPPASFDCAPGDVIDLRGPLGHAFQIPPFAKKIALIALDDSIARLYGLISLSLKQNAEIVLVCNSAQGDLPEVVEIQPLQALTDVLKWADYAAFDVQRENLNRLKEMLKNENQLSPKIEAQILVHAPMPCGGIAECGVCGLTLNREWKMICKEGPVFNFDVLASLI